MLLRLGFSPNFFKQEEGAFAINSWFLSHELTQQVPQAPTPNQLQQNIDILLEMGLGITKAISVEGKNFFPKEAKELSSNQ